MPRVCRTRAAAVRHDVSAPCGDAGPSSARTATTGPCGSVSPSARVSSQVLHLGGRRRATRPQANEAEGPVTRGAPRGRRHGERGDDRRTAGARVGGPEPVHSPPSGNRSRPGPALNHPIRHCSRLPWGRPAAPAPDRPSGLHRSRTGPASGGRWRAPTGFRGRCPGRDDGTGRPDAGRPDAVSWPDASTTRFPTGTGKRRGQRIRPSACGPGTIRPGARCPAPQTSGKRLR